MMDEEETRLAEALRSGKSSPGAGFESRLLHGAYARLRARRRRRGLLVAANLALAAAAVLALVRGAPRGEPARRRRSRRSRRSPASPAGCASATGATSTT